MKWHGLGRSSWILSVMMALGALLALTSQAGRSQVLPPSSPAGSAGAQIFAATLPTWQQVNSSGFGTSLATDVSALADFNGFLYAATHNATDGARIFRSQDGATWLPVIEPGFGNSHDTRPLALLDLTAFATYLYAGSGRGGNAAKIWRSADGLNWAPVVNNGFGVPANVEVTVLAAYEGLVYAGVTNAVDGARIYRSFSGDSNSWAQVAPDTAGTDTGSVTALAEFDGALYAAVQSNSGPVQIWRSFGGAAATWAAVVNDGFGADPALEAGGMAVFAGRLYVGTGHATAHAQIWRSADGEAWEQVIGPGFGDANNVLVESLFVFENQLYAGTRNAATGVELWRSANGTSWERANSGGFGDAGNVATNGSNATAAFLGRLYIGVENSAGGEVWRMLNDYGVALSADAELSGSPGSQVLYSLTLTNTGVLTDTINLGASGNSWNTVLGAASLTLSPATSAVFTVGVSIPAGAAQLATDTVVVTAISQSDPGATDTAILTTTAAAPPGPTFPLSVALAGSGSGTVLGIPANPAAIAQGATVTLTAAPAPSSVFAGWSGDCAGAGVCVLVMNAARSVTATFTLKTYSLSVGTAGAGTGSIAGIPSNPGALTHGTTVTLTATPAAGSDFAGWSGDCSGAGPCVLTMTAAKSVTATFTLEPRNLKVAMAGNGSGAVQGVPPAPDAIAPGTVLTLMAAPDAGSGFAGWSGDCGGTGACVLTMNADKTVTATFTLKTYVLTATTAGDGAGSIQGIPDHPQAIPHGAVVALTAQAATGSIFVGWEGSGCTGTGICMLVMDSAKTVTATFAIEMLGVALPVSFEGGEVRVEVVTSTVAADAACVTVGLVGSGATVATYPYGTVLRLTAIPHSGYAFDGWSGSLSGSDNPKIVTLQTPLLIGARFVPIKHSIYLPAVAGR